MGLKYKWKPFFKNMLQFQVLDDYGNSMVVFKYKLKPSFKNMLQLEVHDDDNDSTMVLKCKLKMSFKNMLEFQDEVGIICSKDCGSRLGSEWVFDHASGSVETIKESEQSRWANMPSELLRDVLMRVEVSESNWPSRKYVVSCAGVCRNWRKIMKEIVKCPQLSGKLTFPISLKQPGSVGSPTECVIARCRNHQIYYLYIHKSPASYYEGKFLLAAKRVRRATCTEYMIFQNYEDIIKGSSTCIGKLRSNFLRTKFIVYDAHPPNAVTKFHPVSSISYEVNALGNGGPRQMRCEINTIPANSFPLPSSFKLTDTSGLRSLTGQKDVKLVLKNKMPMRNLRWEYWYLDFNGRVNYGSVKNFQLVACCDNEVGVKEHENIILQSAKVGKDYHTMDYHYPISAFQAFSICLSSFDTNVAGERGWLQRFGGRVHYSKYRP